jgi:hypothetical protein
LKTLFPDDNPESDTEFHKDVRQRIEMDYNSPDDYLFTVTEVTQIIESQNEAKSPAIDGFTADIVKQLHSTDPQFMTDLQ